VRFLLPRNRETIERWVADWWPQAIDAARALDPEFTAEEVALPDVVAEPARRVRRGRTPITRRQSVAVNGDAGYDYVGIVMAKSAEGDAVAAILGAQEGVEVIEQPSFYDIRAEARLAIKFADVSEQLGYEIDAYSIQREMSTHYGRMVATDDALMLFSDPTEAMQYLMS
jgi:propane monooxygenase coupling protein